MIPSNPTFEYSYKVDGQLVNTSILQALDLCVMYLICGV